MVDSIKCYLQARQNQNMPTEFGEWWRQKPNYNMLRSDYKVKLRQSKGNSYMKSKVERDNFKEGISEIKCTWCVNAAGKDPVDMERLKIQWGVLRNKWFFSCIGEKEEGTDLTIEAQFSWQVIINIPLLKKKNLIKLIHFPLR